MTREVRTFTHTAPAPPRDVFPLLCPIREEEWIPGWHGQVVYSESGVAEPDGIFVAGLQGGTRSTFFVTRHEPPRAIEYLVLGDEGLADKLAITLEEGPGGTSVLHWRRVYTGLTPDGAERAAAAARAFEARVPRLAALLEEHLRR